MNITPATLRDDPSQYLFALDLDRDVAHLLEMDREAIFRSIFLDGRIDRGQRPARPVTIDAMLQAFEGLSLDDRKVGLIFHVAQCGSTLLARALDHPGKSLSLREPYALRQLGVLYGGDSGASSRLAGERFRNALRMTLAMYGKSWPGESTVVLKANVPVNCIAEQIMDLNPAAPAVTLYFGLEDYVAAVMRTDGHEKWVETVYAELRLDRHPFVTGSIPQSTAERTAALWFVQMKAFEAVLSRFAGVRSLDAAYFLDDPVPVVDAAAKHFGVQLTLEEIQDLVDGDMFQTYSKNPTLDYDPEVRVARESASKKRLAAEIDQAFDWAKAAVERHGLVETFAAPLVEGSAMPLLQRG